MKMLKELIVGLIVVITFPIWFPLGGLLIIGEWTLDRLGIENK